MLGRVIGQHWLPLVRDVLALGYRAEDILTTLSVSEMCAIVSAAPPDSSVGFALSGGWTRTDHLLANMQEGSAGLADLTQPYARPGLEQRPGSDGAMFGGRAQAMTWDEAEERDRKRYAAAAAAAARGIKPTYKGGATKVKALRFSS